MTKITRNHAQEVESFKNYLNKVDSITALEILNSIAEEKDCSVVQNWHLEFEKIIIKNLMSSLNDFFDCVIEDKYPPVKLLKKIISQFSALLNTIKNKGDRE